MTRAWPTPLPRISSSIHVRLTALFAGLFVVAGAGLLAVNYTLLAAGLPKDSSGAWFSREGVPANLSLTTDLGTLVTVQRGATGRVDGVARFSADAGPAEPGGRGIMVAGVASGVSPGAPTTGASAMDAPVGAPPMEVSQLVSRAADNGIVQYRKEALGQLVRESLTALAVTTVLAVGLGLLVARRVLRPVRRITETARRLGDGSLDERLVVSGPRDELRELGETFNAMLDRLQASFRRERQLLANVSHELRTPLANQRTALEVGLADPEADTTALRRIANTALAQNVRAQHLIERLFLLARVQELAPAQTGPVDLAHTVRTALDGLEDTEALARLDVELALAPAVARGDGVLIERLAANLIQNAVRHNRDDGWIQVSTRVGPDGRCLLQVRNSGPQVAAADVAALFQPFRRGAGDRVRSDRGIGLGLAIVLAVVQRHHGTLDAEPVPGGGLAVRVALPAAHAELTDTDGPADTDELPVDVVELPAAGPRLHLVGAGVGPGAQADSPS